jgi:hypothetical protein
MQDPHEHLLTDDDEYVGLFVWPLTDEKGVTRHVVSLMRSTHDGGMREFVSPIDRETCVGSCGCIFAAERVRTLDEYVSDLEGA